MRQSPSSKKSPNLLEIKAAYYGSTLSREKSPTIINTDLTPSAKFVAREAKKRLGEYQAFAEKIKPDESELFSLVRTVEESEKEILSERERTMVVANLSSSLDHYDILTPLVENPEINDIIITSFKDISVQKNRANVKTDLSFPDFDSYKAFIENLLKKAGKSCTMAHPVVDAAIDPHVRVCVTHESFSPPGMGPMMTLRIARHRNITLEALQHNELAPKTVLDYLAAIIHEGKHSLLIAGEVGTGKTTLVKALASRIRESEAILIIEDTHELVINRAFVRTLLTREANTEGAGKISPAQAIRAGMRMAMNRLLLGEMRDAEAAEAFIDVCSSGHAGMSTIHARSARDAIARLELLLSRAQPGVNFDTIRRQIANSISAVVFLGVEKETEKRRIVEIVEIGSFADGAVQYSPIFTYAPINSLPYWKRDGGVSTFSSAFTQYNISLPAVGESITFDAESMYHNYPR